MTDAEPMRPTVVETVLFEPDERRTLAVLPGAIWLSPGDVVELSDPPRDARVLSARLQLGGGSARILVVLDVPDHQDDALRGDAPTEAVLAGDLDEPVLDLGAELDRDLEALEADVELAPEEGAPGV
jgi:hypothetical protein